MDAWEFIVKYEPALRSMCRKKAGLDTRPKWKGCKRVSQGDPQLADELYDVAVDQVQSAFQRYDEARGSIYNWVKSNVLWALHKYVVLRRRRWDRHDEDGHSIAHDHSKPDELRSLIDPDSHDAVQYLLSQLDERERYVLVARHCAEMTFDEIRWELDIGKSTVLNLYASAVAKAREILNADDH